MNRLAAMPAPTAALDARDILTPKELAERLKVKTSWVYKASAAGTIPVLRVGNYLRFDWNAVSAWLRKGER
jgi:excisionase family DNA binding protein